MAPAAQPALIARPLGPAPAASPSAGQRLVETLERISRNGGHVQYDPAPRPYRLRGGTHLNASQELHGSLWRFHLSATARDILDHLSVAHDEDGITAVTQKQLAHYFRTSQPTISRALAELARHHFIWKARRGHYQLHPLYAYRFSSRKHRRLIERLGPATLEAHKIVVPLPQDKDRP
ncbi:hypothetical protein ACIO3O_37965 [Streptomyces sp. NPDC087440]|uniref:hypothetical protein n=1 Tax=Streptomyces sp. NPDC087440 TaxID=3365790 RepID=UPI0038120F20